MTQTATTTPLDLPEGWLIRDADPDRDAAACLEIYRPAITEGATSFEEVVPSVPEFAERIRKAGRSHAWLVMEDHGRVVGYAYASAHQARAAYRWAANVSVYVAPTHWRSGVGRRLYAALFDRMRARHYQVLCAGITVPNERSVGLHRAMGFEEVGTYKRIGYKLGAWHDVVWLQLELERATAERPTEPAGD